MLVQALLVSVLASLLSIEYMNGHFGFARPLIAGALTGLILGDLTQGIIVGASLQLIFMGIGSVGSCSTGSDDRICCCYGLCDLERRRHGDRAHAGRAGGGRCSGAGYIRTDIYHGVYAYGRQICVKRGIW